MKSCLVDCVMWRFLAECWLNPLFCVRRLNVLPSCSDTMSTISPTDFDSLEIQQQYNDINNRWDLAAETDWDNENSSARLFERSRIKALAGRLQFRHVGTAASQQHSPGGLTTSASLL